MKKLIMLALGVMLLITGCKDKTEEDLIAKFEKNITNSKSYILKGNMEILSNEETFTYSLEASYLKDDYYKVTLVNQTNNHEQIILKNKEGVYVVTPTLNKSFKFQSEWPSNSSQSYILSSLLNDMKKEDKISVEEQDKNYIVKTKVNYPNNSALTYQIVNIKVVFSSIDLKAGLSEEDFLLEDLIDLSEDNDKNENKDPNKDDSSEKEEEQDTNKDCKNEECDTESSNVLDDIIYPLYIPSETYLSNSEEIDTDSGNRMILTFAGDKNFVLIEEVANVASEFEIIPVYGDPVMLSDTIAAKSANSLYWTSDNVSYYLTSNDLSTEEMVTIAESLGNTKVVSGSK